MSNMKAEVTVVLREPVWLMRLLVMPISLLVVALAYVDNVLRTIIARLIIKTYKLEPVKEDEVSEGYR